ncbi:yippee zinc-binding/DNA-binding /Mis18, centromere assembly-domain-containing protein [Lipomyces arxii]|uniref:yippee zinc-binding/DNA-binding /Mis18, centromere assembly-domain-containing protein n=1 Tax=Lipomyces arxii TaxID=56418 RepID=UPI0034CE5182
MRYCLKAQLFTITITVVVFFVVFLLWQVLLATLIVRPVFYYTPAISVDTLESTEETELVPASGSQLHSRFLCATTKQQQQPSSVMMRPKRLLSYFSPPRRRVLDPTEDYYSSEEFEDDYFDSSNGSVSLATSPTPSSLQRSRGEKLLSDVQSHPLTIFRCRKCLAHLAPYSRIISKSFTGRLGRAVLVSGVQNVRLGKPGQRMLVTGLHSVADIACASCDVNVGWKYIDAFERSQGYKVGKYILELKRVVKETVAVTEDDMDWSDFQAFPQLDLNELDIDVKLPSEPQNLRRGSTSLVLRKLLDDDQSLISGLSLEDAESQPHEITTV